MSGMKTATAHWTTEDTQPTLLLTLGEVASHLRCTRRSVEREVARHHLRVVRIGRSVRVERRELNRYLKSLSAPDEG
ncbi:helix-turn-helix domain-containing protein [Pedococcus sp. 5OH_020]|uniref:helix-turn-helix domain-containing protein n=1 Tax=Pedococcus sp. 5OH_020 TaxID=2989814 RepID=UPI0022E9B635|nr:helix-turn-helix domain-containing protein [Pedococcus sp. 5OH_020]